MAKTLKQLKAEKVSEVMRDKTVHSGKGGKIIKDPKQKIAVALSIASKVKLPKKKKIKGVI